MISKISISIPKNLEDFARWRVRHCGYGSVSEYFRELVRIDQRYEIERNKQSREEARPRTDIGLDHRRIR
jgi:Arc/MetJ-type ribon-helix-helix transcriptional regulator